jgi:sulfonate transport system permease protein
LPQPPDYLFSLFAVPVRSFFLSACGLMAFLLIWEAVPFFELANPLLFPPPSALPEAFIKEIASGIWAKSLGQSLTHYMEGLFLGAGLGVMTGIMTGMSRVGEDLTAWVVRVLRPIPGLAWVPFAILWFGATPAAAVFIIAIGVFWTVYFAAHGAIRAVDRDLIEVAEAFGFHSALEKLVKIYLPAAAPGILVGLRTALGQAWMAVVAAEIFGVAGLGQRMMQASSLLASDLVILYMLTMAALYGAFDVLFLLFQKRVLQWKA